MSIKCSNCQAAVDVNAKFCPNCGCKLKKKNNILDIIFLVLLIIYSIYAVYTTYNIVNDFLNYTSLYSDIMPISDYIYYIDYILYHILTTLSLWGIFAYNKPTNKPFIFTSGIMLLASIFISLVYIVIYAFSYDGVSIIEIFSLLTSRYLIIGMLYLLAIKANNLIKEY